MYKSFLTSAILASALIAGPAMAQDNKCSDEITRVDGMAKQPANVDAGKSEMAEAQLKIARELERKGDEAGCMDAVDKAEGHLKSS